MAYRSVCGKDICTGCGACRNVCPSGAIRMQYDTDDDGSLRPVIDANRCTECGQCRTLCPALHKPENNNRTSPDCYAVWANNVIRGQSSSGGAFTLLANRVLDGGGVVSGVAYGDRFRPEHVIIANREELDPLRGSKYVQSDTKLVFSQIKTHLDEGKEVLFVGCPCQVAGLHAYLQKDYSRLIAVDFICNYAPPYFIFEKYLEENFGIDNIDSIRFRIKRYGWVPDVHRVTLKNGTFQDRREYEDMYHRGYHPRLFMRRVCENCQFSEMPRQGDLTIGDFWGIKQFFPKYDDTKGTSLVLVNNEKGQSVFETLKKEMQLCEQVPLETLCHNRPPKAWPHWARDRFYEIVKTLPFNKAVDYSLGCKFDAVILGLWTEKNYGSELTYYALYRVVTAFGLEVQMLERPWRVPWGPNSGPILFRHNPYSVYGMSGIYETKLEMDEVNRHFDTFIVGSDQMWYHGLYNNTGQVGCFDYVHNNKKKIAYATSFGKEFWTGTEAERQEMAFYLKNFDHISIRETSGVEICKDRFGVQAEWVLDPIFLCGKEHFQALADKSEMQTEERFIGVYMLDITPEKIELLQKVQSRLGIGVSIISDARKDGALGECDVEVRKDAFVEDWIKNIIKSDFVVTDSFHGMCFAIIFRKPFIAIANRLRGAVRFGDFLRKINLEKRLVSESDRIDDITPFLDAIDYDAVHAILDKEIERSLAWLKNAVFTEKKHQLSEYDVLLKKINEAACTFSRELKRHDDLILRHDATVNSLVARHDETINNLILRYDEAIHGHAASIHDIRVKIFEFGKRLKRWESGLMVRFGRKAKRLLMPIIDVFLSKDSNGWHKVGRIYHKLRG